MLDRMRAAGIGCGFDLGRRLIICAGAEPSADSLRELAARLLNAATAMDGATCRAAPDLA